VLKKDLEEKEIIGGLIKVAMTLDQAKVIMEIM
jgi:hypothetical protein